jgi:SAM-dependent methyltransferase
MIQDPQAGTIHPTGSGLRWSLTLLFLVLGSVLFAWGMRWIGGAYEQSLEFKEEHHRTAIALGSVLLIAAVAFGLLHARYHRRAREGMSVYGQAVDGATGGMRWLDLTLASVLGLFLEVALIRWHGTEFRACAYFKNITLLACFLGLGLGFARARRPVVTFPLTLVLLALQVLLMDVLSLAEADRAIRNPISSETLWGIASVTHAVHLAVFYGFFTALFVSTIVIFIPIGQLTGRLMETSRPLASYTINIVGSIAGVVLFGLASYLWLPPVVWFGITALLGLWLSRHSRVGVVAGGCAAAAMLAWVGFEPRRGVHDVYSPYQRLEYKVDNAYLPDGRLVKQGVWVSANKTYYMQGMDLSNDFVAKWADRIEAVRHKSRWYNLPYQFKPAPGKVLIVGSGAGNDVAAAARNGAGHIDAVEIDPAIRWIGETYHPESPYQAPQVRVIVNDARAFMRRSEPAQYDLIIFGLLDSHTLLSSMASIRLDNFVYTQESMDDARRLLKPGGLVCLSFALGPQQHFAARLYKMLTKSFGHPPRTFGFERQDTMFVVGLESGDVTSSGPAGEGVERYAVPETTEVVAATASRLEPPPAEDDWPFPFLPSRTWASFPRPYIYLIAVLVVISTVWVLGTKEHGSGLSGHFFFLGGAFLLIETKGITELALIFGTTWVVTSVVITAILVLILLANWTVHVLGLTRPHVAYLGLMASLLAGYFIPIQSLLDRGFMTAAAASSTLLCLPLYFAGIVFATSLKHCRSLPAAFASNLLGAILGGLCEYMSMVTGFRSLYLAGMVLYGLSWVCLLGSRRGAEAGVATTAQ